MDVSIVIVNWNTKELLCNCLESVEAQTGKVNYEIIVVDNDSFDGSAEMVVGRFPKVAIITNNINHGYATAINQGIKLAKGRYILVLNSDIIICEDAIAKTIEYADKHPEAAVVGPQVREDEYTIQPTCFGYPGPLNLAFRFFGLARFFPTNHFFGREMMQWWNRRTVREVDVVSGMFMLVRRIAIEQVGMMDESYFLYYEETDWCLRFSKAGWKMVFWPGAKIIHIGGGSHSSNQLALRMHLQERKSLLIFFRKHYGLTSYMFARSMLIADSAIRYCIWTAWMIFNQLRSERFGLEKDNREKCRLVLGFCLLGIES